MRKQLLLLALTAVITPTSSASAAVNPAVAVDFARSSHVGNALGFMHGGESESLLLSDVARRFRARAQQLQPGIWRGVPQQWSLNLSGVTASGAQPIVQLGDMWGLPGHWPKTWPYEDLSAYSAWVKAKAAQLARQFPTGAIWVDVWNEPDTAKFWPTWKDPKLAGYMRTFLEAEHVLRNELGSRVKLIGPSTSGHATLWTGRLLSYCAAHGCRVDAVAWHVCHGGPKMMSGLGSALKRARAKASEDPVWRRALSSRPKFIVTEYTPIGQRSKPGALMAYWSQLESGGAGGAAFATWRTGASQDGLLDSLLDIDGRPRTTWWAAKAYSSGRQSRVSASTSSPLWPVLASKTDASGAKQVMLGSWGPEFGHVRLSLSGLPR
ncbi:MAG: hypothetical protein NTX07_01515, partial [Solirubrobacterales bacterium]|nr:hypothetical protein [Solirubrobacterales bacterium]